MKAFWKSLYRFFDKRMAWILHVTLFNRSAGEVYFYGLDECEDNKPFDGEVLLIDRRFQQRHDRWEAPSTTPHQVYGYRFENTYYQYLPVSLRVMAVWSALLKMDMVHPLLVIENGMGYTPYGHYPEVPVQYRLQIERAYSQAHLSMFQAAQFG